MDLLVLSFPYDNYISSLLYFLQQQQQPATPNTPQQPPQQQKEINTAMVCRIGQESVQDIISRTHEVFSYLRVLQVQFRGFTKFGIKLL